MAPGAAYRLFSVVVTPRTPTTRVLGPQFTLEPGPPGLGT